MDIVFSDFVYLVGHQYALLLVDMDTRYCWLYGMYSLSSSSITSDLEVFKSELGKLPLFPTPTLIRSASAARNYNG